MICTLTARRLKPGATGDFKAAFEQAAGKMPDDMKGRWTTVYVCRDVTDDHVLLTFGLFNGTVDELREIQAQAGDEAPAAAVGDLVEGVLLDGSYEVLAELTP
jgi:hypothetical protein